MLWSKVENKAIEYATIKENEDYTISNENGVFEIEKTSSNITIQSLIYEKLNSDFEFLKVNDTIYLNPLTYELAKITISKDGLYKKMRKNVLKRYALKPHKEKFFLRAVIRKNNKFYKIIDFSGLVEKKTLFDTKRYPMSKKNYKIQIDTIRKAGIENKNIGFKMVSFREFFSYLITLSFSDKGFKISYEDTKNEDFTKIILEAKEKSEIYNNGYYILDEDDNFKEANVTWTNNSSF